MKMFRFYSDFVNGNSVSGKQKWIFRRTIFFFSQNQAGEKIYFLFFKVTWQCKTNEAIVITSRKFENSD